MEQSKTNFILVILLFVMAILGMAAAYATGFIPTGLDVFIVVLIIVSGIYAVMAHFKRHRDTGQGIPVDDEMSTRIKYKAGHHAFLASLYLWLFIFLFNDVFNDVETMLGSGIMLSAVISIVIRAYLNRHYREDQD